LSIDRLKKLVYIFQPSQIEKQILAEQAAAFKKMNLSKKSY